MKKFTDIGAIGCTVPLHDIVAIGTLVGLLKQAKVPNEEFIEALRN